MENGMFARMCKDAAEELASGERGWRDAPHNVVLLACFHLLSNHLAHTITKPLWWAAGSIGAAAIIVAIKTLFTWIKGG